METNPEHSDTIVQLNYFIAENESLKAQLEEYQYAIVTRDKEIENLQRRISGNIELISNSDNQLQELHLLQENVRQLQKRTESAGRHEIKMEKQTWTEGNTEQQLDNIKEEYAYLKTQLEDIQEQLQQLNNSNLILQQKNNEVNELESFLEDVQRERDELKEQLALRGEN